MTRRNATTSSMEGLYRQGVLHAAHGVLVQGQRSLIERLHLENLSLRGVRRVVGVSIQWLRDGMVACFEAAPEHWPVRLPGRFPLRCDDTLLGGRSRRAVQLRAAESV